MEIYDKLEQFLFDNPETPTNFVVEVQKSGVFVSATRYLKDPVTGEQSEDYWGNFYDSPEQGLEECLNMMERLEFNRSLKQIKFLR